MSRLTFTRPFPFLLLSLSASLVSAEIRYTVQPLPDQNRIKVQVQLDSKKGALELQMPNWSPGAYFLSAPARNVQDFRIVNANGAPLSAEKPNDFTWKATLASAGKLTAEYTVPSQLVAGAMHYNGPSAYLYAVGRKQEKCRLTLEVPEGWRIAVGLDSWRGSNNVFTAPNYDVLADNPVTMGDFIELSYTVQGIPHTISLRGEPRDQVEKEKILKVCKHITESQADFFGGLPYSKYVWHFNVTPGQDGGGGLEHLSSTQIGLAAGVGPRSVSVCSHEFFHLWNVKRIRSKPLGPFDYTELPKTGALYWLEGVTDYYASLLLLRYGWFGPEEFHRDLASNIALVRNNPARLEVSPYESSMRVGEANNGRGNSNGWRISYYNVGWLVGLCLDIEMRTATGGKKSLDDVARALWRLCRDDRRPGFEEEEIRNQCVKIGGPQLGEFFDRMVMTAGELPLEEQLAKVGLKLVETKTDTVDPGFDWGGGFGQTGLRVTEVRGDAKGKLESGDLILEIDGANVQGESRQETMGKMTAALAKLTVGTLAKVKVRRGTEDKEAEIVPSKSFRVSFKVEEDPLADEAKQALRQGWYYAKRQGHKADSRNGT